MANKEDQEISKEFLEKVMLKNRGMLTPLLLTGQQGVGNTKMPHAIYDENRAVFFKMTREYIEKFPEVENKLKVFENSELTDQDKIEQFLIYTYWSFDENYSMTLRFSRDKDESQFENIIDELWFETKYQFDFYYKYRIYTKKMCRMSYQEFSEFASKIENHKLDFFKVK
ncbi:hypothetical protein VNN41_09805 [Lactococcus garvieae]|uniref:hypothetical protein n=1 Tax=Lactococcus garvieae TaxID=1363 RepID=UPI003252DB05